MIRLSIVIPAYNEADRLPRALESIRAYLGQTFQPTEVEVIVVDDGSIDDTVKVIRKQFSDWDRLRILELPQNEGKGAAVRAGCIAALGDFVLFSDADGAAPIAEERSLRQALEQTESLCLVAGVRYSAAACVRMTLVRRMMGVAFSRLASWVVGRPCQDTQCGFKMFRRGVVMPHLLDLVERGFAFDVELLARIHRSGLRFAEVPVRWTHVAGGKVSILRHGPRMLWNLFRIHHRVHHLLPDKSRLISQGAVCAARVHRT